MRLYQRPLDDHDRPAHHPRKEWRELTISEDGFTKLRESIFGAPTAFLGGAPQGESVPSEATPALTLVDAGDDNQKPQKRGPKPGTVDRFGAADRALYPEYEALLRPADPNVPAMSRRAASLKLAEEGKIKGNGTAESRAKRFRDRYRDDHPNQ